MSRESNCKLSGKSNQSNAWRRYLSCIIDALSRNCLTCVECRKRRALSGTVLWRWPEVEILQITENYWKELNGIESAIRSGHLYKEQWYGVDMSNTCTHQRIKGAGASRSGFPLRVTVLTFSLEPDRSGMDPDKLRENETNIHVHWEEGTKSEKCMKMINRRPGFGEIVRVDEDETHRLRANNTWSSCSRMFSEGGILEPTLLSSRSMVLR